MHMPAAVAWAEWAVWTCNTPQRVLVDQGLAGQKTGGAFLFGAVTKSGRGFDDIPISE
jgi:hypothetical protein